jgi:hypothetical protein
MFWIILAGWISLVERLQWTTKDASGNWRNRCKQGSPLS